MMKIAGSAIQKHPGGFPEANAEVFALCYVAPIVLALQMYDIDLYNRLKKDSWSMLRNDIRRSKNLSKYRVELNSEP